ncbi:MAG: M61 family metallopeptidase [Bernardetiaceae bacterium]|nr:M61 family metallopeptidase [Bernardetiaceae bacterium]
MSKNTFFYAFALLLFAFIDLPIEAQPVSYEIFFPNRVHHEIQVRIDFENLDTDSLCVQMSRSSPGRYALHEFAKNVYNVRAEDKDGNPLSCVRKDPHSWLVKQHRGFVSFYYTLFADQADGTYSGINSEFLHLNIPATFAWSPQTFEREVALKIASLPKDWQVATQLKRENDTLFSAPHGYYFMDSPIYIGELEVRTWEQNGQQIQLALLHTGDAREADTYSEILQKITKEEEAIFGALPDFDFGTYTFLANYHPYAKGDGMEHRNSTILSSSYSLSDNMLGLAFTAAHEFIHAWNVERLRPATLEPFNFMDYNMSDALWFAEGFTSYYTNLVMLRTGLISESQYLNMLRNNIRTVIESPGHQYHSQVEMSQQAAFADAATANDPLCHHNTYISYYTFGAALGLVLDLELRSEFNSDLDAYMRLLWQKYGKTETPYTLEDLQTTLAELCKSEVFAKQFFEQHVIGKTLPDFKQILAKAGLSLQIVNPTEASLQQPIFDASTQGLKLTEYPTVGSPLYEAGIDKGDIILTIGDTKINSIEQLNKYLANQKIGQTQPMTFKRLNRIEETKVTFAADSKMSIRKIKGDAQQEKIRTQWLSSQQ